MELTGTQLKIMKTLVDATVMCLKSMAGLSARPGKETRDAADSFWANDYIFVIDTHGEVDGRIVMHYFMLACWEMTTANLSRSMKRS